MVHEGDGDTNCNWHAWNDPLKLGKGAGSVGYQRTNRDHPNYSTIEIHQNIEETWCHPGSSKGQPVNADVKNSQSV